MSWISDMPSENSILEPRLFIPEHLGISDLEDITCVGDEFKKFRNKDTGEIHDCAEYYKQYIGSLEK